MLHACLTRYLSRRPAAGPKRWDARPQLEALEHRWVPSFAAPVEYPAAGPFPISATAGDFNNDGKVDVVTTNNGSASVSLLLGNGDGTFQPAVSVPVGAVQPFDVQAADLNNDGNLDLVTANASATSDGSVSVLLGNGDGTFGAPAVYPVGGRPFSVAIADLNNDGSPDIVVGTSANTVSVLLNNGDGTFAPAQTFAAGPRTTGVAVGDFNNDGNPDILVTNYDGASVSLLLGNGDGTFQAPRAFATGSQPISVAVGDLNGDGNLDFAVANFNGGSNGTVSVFLGNGDGTFQPRQDYAAGNGPESVAIADLNNDGNLDLAMGIGVGGTVSVLLGNGDGTFGPLQSFAGGTFLSGSHLAVADFNGDGFLDIAAADEVGNAVTVLLNNADWSAPAGGAAMVTGLQAGQAAAATPLAKARPEAAAPLSVADLFGAVVGRQRHEPGGLVDDAPAVLLSGPLN
jgi:hypothetical protein